MATVDARGVPPDRRFKRRAPCPICGGGDDDRRGRQQRCSGFLSADGEWAHCTREEHAGSLQASTARPPTYAHRMRGACGCGVTHNPAPLSAAEMRPKATEVYHVYRDANGKALYRIVRQTLPDGKKRIYQQHPDGKGGWMGGRGGVGLVLYRLDELAKADHETTVYVVEGEKCADALAALGYLATTSAEGAGKWHSTPGATEALRGRRIVILPDNDEPGHAHAEQVATALTGVAAEVRLVTLPDLPEKGDVYDWFQVGHKMTELVDLVEHAVPRYIAPSAILPGVIIADVERQSVRWLWRGRLALGKLAIIDGDPGQGKGLLTIDLVARLTRGRTMPDGSPGLPAANVVMLTPEDDPADTIRPRLEAAEADLRRVRVLSTVSETDPETGATHERFITIPRDIPLLEQAILADGASMLLIDPIMACLDGGVKTNSDAEVRAALMPLKGLAERTGIAIPLVRHLNKGGGDNALYRGGGSIAFTGLCRTAFLVATHPDDAERRVLAAVKSNISRLASSLTFRLVSDAPDAVPYVNWDTEPCDMDARALLSARKSDERREIIAYMKEVGTRVNATDISEALGISYNTAKVRLHRMHKAGEVVQPSRGYYELPLIPPVTTVTTVTSSNPVTTVTNHVDDDLTTKVTKLHGYRGYRGDEAVTYEQYDHAAAQAERKAVAEWAMEHKYPGVMMDAGVFLPNSEMAWKNFLKTATPGAIHQMLDLVQGGDGAR